MLDKHRKKWRSKIRGWKDQILKTQNGAVDIHAQEMAADAEEAMGVAAAGDVQFCQYSANIICLDEDADRLYESTRLVMKTVQNLGLLLPHRRRQRGRGVARVASGRRLLQRPPGPSAYAESRRHDADHFGVGGPARESQSLYAEEEPGSSVRSHERRDSRSGSTFTFPIWVTL